MNHGAHVGLVSLGAVDMVINGQKVRCWQFVRPLHEHSLAASSFERRSGSRRSDTPLSGRLHVAVDLAIHLAHRQTIIRNFLFSVAGRRTKPVWARN